MTTDPAAPTVAELAAAGHRALRIRGSTVAVAESLTGGLLGAALTEAPGSSVTFRGGVIAYATDLKAGLLDVDPALLHRHGAVHPEVAAAMARGVAARLGATYGLAATGVAGPDAQDGRAPGEVHLALAGPRAGPSGVTVVSGVLEGGRDVVRRAAVRRAIELLVTTVGKAPG